VWRPPGLQARRSSCP